MLRDAYRKQLDKQRREYSMPIFSSKPGAYQMDTVFPKKDSNDHILLWFTNVNTKKSYVYKIGIGTKGKGELDVMAGLVAFKKDMDDMNEPITSITSDRDKAYMTDDTRKYLFDNGIDYWVTNSTNKHVLGPLNRTIRTIRRQLKLQTSPTKRAFTDSNVQRLLNQQNLVKKRPFAGHTTEEMTNKKELEIDYIAGRMNEADRRREQMWKGVQVGAYCRIYNMSEHREHGDGNLDPHKWKIHKIDKFRGKVYIGGENEKDGLMCVPRYQILTDKKYLKGNSEPVPTGLLKKKIVSIIGHTKNKYKVEYEDKTKGEHTWAEIRGQQLNNPTQMEYDYEKSKITNPYVTRRSAAVYNNMPDYIRNYLPEDFKRKQTVSLIGT